MVHSMPRRNGTYVLEHRLKRGYRSLGEEPDAPIQQGHRDRAANWYIINYYVPAIGVAHVLIFVRLFKAYRLKAGN